MNGQSGSDRRLRTPIEVDEIREVAHALLGRDLGRDPDFPKLAAQILSRGTSVLDFVRALRRSGELAAAITAETDAARRAGALDDGRFRIPRDLARTETAPARVLLVGSCLLEVWQPILAGAHPATEFDFVTVNNASTLPPLDPARPIDLQILQIPLRAVVPEAAYFQIPATDEAAHEALFVDAVAALERNFDAVTLHARTNGVTSFLLDFAVPQQNHLGRLMPRWSLANPVHFVERLNRELHRLAAAVPALTILPFDEIVAGFGRKYYQDDSITHWNHGSYVGIGFTLTGDRDRLEPIGDRDRLYAPQGDRVVLAAWDEVLATLRTRAQTDAIKLVIFDLDDTLWRGVAADADEVAMDMGEGWPLGIVEAAAYLWQRGVLLAIVSKNDPERAEAIWNRLYGANFALDRFVARRIGWGHKADSVRAIIAEVNVLPERVLFVDDNPDDRAAVRDGVPGIRVLDAPLLQWRRILLWSAETQKLPPTAESAARTEMVRAQIARETDRAGQSREDFLAGLDVHVAVTDVASPDHPAFERCLELIGKTNQFNTTGRRWTRAELADFLAAGGLLRAAEVADRYTPYGIVAVLVADGATIEQLVMSCRVFGMAVEQAVIADHCRRAPAGLPIVATLTDTGRNRLCHSLWSDLGFTKAEDGHWHLPRARADALPWPKTVREGRRG